MTDYKAEVSDKINISDSQPKILVTKVRKLRAISSFISQPKYLGIMLLILFVLINVLYFVGYSIVLTLMVADAEFAVASIALIGIIQRGKS